MSTEGFGVFIIVLLLAGYSLFVSAQARDDAVKQAHKQDAAIIACIENTSYTRTLFGQCLDDYKQAGK